MKAYSYRSGRIEFCPDRRKAPEGTITIGRHRRIRKVVGVLARWAYDNKTPLVPGVPEASTEMEATEALIRFSRAVRERLAKL